MKSSFEERDAKIVKNKTLNRSDENKNIEFSKVKELQKQGALIIDVRSTQEYEEVHIQGAISIPVYEMERSKYNWPKDKIIVVYCTNGGRSKRAQNYLRNQGYTNVYNLINY